MTQTKLFFPREKEEREKEKEEQIRREKLEEWRATIDETIERMGGLENAIRWCDIQIAQLKRRR